MLLSLYIKDFILIDELEIDFRDGFSVFTGETGAGKSIFIDCISILSGDKMSTSMIREGCQRTIIEGNFEVDDALAAKLEEAGFDTDSFIVTREINRDGKSVTRLNHRAVTVSFIRECLSDYVDIHNQRDSQYLINERNHLNLLDSYLNRADLLSDVSKAYDEYHDLDNKYNELLNNEFNEAQLEVIKYQLDEIDKLDLKPQEEESIQEKLKLFREKEKLNNTINSLREIFSSEEGVLSQLYSFTRIADQLKDFAEVKSSVEDIVSSYYQISDSYDQIISYFDNDSIDVDSIDEMNQRLYDIQRIKRKYNSSVEQILELRDSLEQQIDNYSNREKVLGRLLNQKNEALDRYNAEADLLTQQRKDAAKQLEKAVIKEIADLSLEKARFVTEFEPGSPSRKGSDKVRFLISMNSGQPLRSLSEVASGGEMSRLMLGLKTIFARLQGSKLVIFDEIDTGVSGYVAFNIGKKMHSISQNIQVFAVTHLASVAAFGDQHYRVSKGEVDNVTTTEITLLNEQQRIEEIAILSSSNTSQASLSAAGELLQNARNSQ